MILWFRRDLRIEDSKLLSMGYGEVLPIFIFDKNILKNLDITDRRVSLIFDEVLNLKSSLKGINLNLALFFATPSSVFEYLKSFGFKRVIASIDSDSYAIYRDEDVSKIVDLTRINDSFLFDRDDILKSDGRAYQVFTSYYKKSLEVLNEAIYLEYKRCSSLKLKEFDFDNLIEIDNGQVFKRDIKINSIGFKNQNLEYKRADEILKNFKNQISTYADNRDILGLDSTSKLSLHLRFGLISIREVVRILKSWQSDGVIVKEFYRQLIWREFFNYILIHYPKIENENFLNIRVDWENCEDKINAFEEAKTGIPIVDAGISELKSTGYMHNRARMIVASFLTKDLHIDWRIGERFFAKYLLDFELSSNVGSWQWASSTGVDAQPYFRIFNPYLQSKKFDSDGNYIKRYIPELKNIDSRYFHNEDNLRELNIKGYPKPIVNHKIESQRAKSMFKKES